MRWKRIAALSCIVAMAAALATGCGANTQEEKNNSTILQVTAMEGNTITGDVGELALPDMGERPEDPNMGERPDASIPEGDTPPAKPDRDMGGQQGGKPGGFGGSVFTAKEGSITFSLTGSTSITVESLQGSQEGSIEDIVIGNILEVELDEDNNAVNVTVKNLNAGSGFGGSGEVTNGSAANTIQEDSTINGETYSSLGDDENALRIDGANVTLDNITIEKTGGASSNTEDGDFYGQNAGLLVLNGGEANITNSNVNTSAVNGNGVFSYGEGTTVNIWNSTIRTSENNSGGIQTTGGGITNAVNLDVETKGNSSAAIRSDRGGGTVNVSEGSYITNGTGSPAIYCTADIHVTDTDLTANASEGIVVEGKNSVSLTDCNVIGNMSNTYHGDLDENIHNIMIYQSMSGDAEVGKAYFSAEGGSIISKSGDMFYVTNTDCEIQLKNVAFTLANDVFLRIEGNSSSRGWGIEGANGGDVALTADTQKMEGNILVDSISSLKLTMKGGSALSGAINPNGQGGAVDIVMDTDSTWTLTADSYINSFDGDLENIEANGYHLYIAGEEAV